MLQVEQFNEFKISKLYPQCPWETSKHENVQKILLKMNQQPLPQNTELDAEQRTNSNSCLSAGVLCVCIWEARLLFSCACPPPHPSAQTRYININK